MNSEKHVTIKIPDGSVVQNTSKETESDHTFEGIAKKNGAVEVSFESVFPPESGFSMEIVSTE